MGVLGIVTCEILKNEFVYLHGNDPDVNKITVLEDTKSASLIELFELKGYKNLHRISHISSFSLEPFKGLDMLIQVLYISLHRKKHIFIKAILSAICEMKRSVDAFLWGYRLFRNTLSHLSELFDVDAPVFRAMDKNQLVADCVSMIIGGKECYSSEQCNIPCTYFMTSCWSYHWKDIFCPDTKNIDLQVLKRVYNNSERSLLILTPVLSENEMKQNIEEFNSLLNLHLERYLGTIEIVDSSWEKAKFFLKI